MATEKGKSDRTLLALGIAISFPMIIAAGPLAGFVIAKYALVGQFSAPAVVVPILTVLGFVASGIQCYRLLKKIK